MGDPAGNTLYLTFDDGPHPDITGFVLDQLNAYKAKGTFFCLGENVARFPETFEAIKNQGHRIGNHTHTHPDGWKMNADDYLKEIMKADKLIGSNLFRPPYGKITKLQVEGIQVQFPQMKIIMWSGVTGDFDTAKTGQWCAAKAIQMANPGNIIVFHDSEKAFPRLKVALPALLEVIAQKQFITGLL